jgi:hypothetical protein
MHAAGLDNFVPANAKNRPLINYLASENLGAAPLLVGHGTSSVIGGILAEDEEKNTGGSLCYCNFLELGEGPASA